MRSNIDMRLGDCMDYMKDLDDNAFELAICDPPYGIGENASRGGKQYGKSATMAKKYTVKNWDDNSASKEYFIELMRISKNQIIFGANHFISKIPYDSSCWIVWDKNNGGSDFADSELAWTSFKTAVRNFKYTWNGMIQEDMKNKEFRIHPTQKPAALYRWLLTAYAQAGDKILDTHGGSGSICLACWDLKFDLTWIEKDKEYYDAAVERFNAHADQLQML